MAPVADDASPSSETGTDHEHSTMCGDKLDQDSADDKSPHQMDGEAGAVARANAKDPSRPRRKKARRACFACQRAHLTCGDERPCLRCVKRGLQDQCHDGVRKKAKYLHDAPAEALVPGFQGSYHSNGTHGGPNIPRPSPSTQHNGNSSQHNNYFPSNTHQSYPRYGPAPRQGPIGPPMLDTSSMVTDFASHQHIETPNRYSSVSGTQVTPSHEIGLDHPRLSANPTFDHAYLDPSDPNYYDFRLNMAELNFGNTYGALEFGMLGHITSSAIDTNDLDALNPMGQTSSNMGFDRSSGFSTNFGYNNGYASNWQHIPSMGSRQNSSNNVWALHNHASDAFAICEHPPSLTASSPKSQNQDSSGNHSGSPDTSAILPEQREQELLRLSHQKARRAPFPSGDPSIDSARKRKRDTSSVYESVKKPYDYTNAFHAMTEFMRKRFDQHKLILIAKALATVRPSFIACNKTLTQHDLVFTEQAFQRAIYEYKEIITQTSTPTIVCRRTGEVAVVSKEFTLMTDWQKDVLLGHEPNLNVNTGETLSDAEIEARSRGSITPRTVNAEVEKKIQPVFLAELMDAESVVDFYGDFAEIAFGASRSSVVGETCTLLKYRTKEDHLASSLSHIGDDSHMRRHSSNGKADNHIKGESGMKALGGKEGRIDCSLCWTVKRDTFNMPLLIVLNFLPITSN